MVLLLSKTAKLSGWRAEGFTSGAEAAVHTLARAHLAAVVVAAGFRTRGAALAVPHVVGATGVVRTHLRGLPGPKLPADVGALMRVL